MVRADRFLLGVTGIHADVGLTTGDADEAAMKRVLAERAAETYVLGSEEKIGAVSPFTVLPFDEVTGVIVDPAAPATSLAALDRRGVPLLRAG